jgi:hypothetical protein
VSVSYDDDDYSQYDSTNFSYTYMIMIMTICIEYSTCD